ncbi:hypothetical protein BaRGS_00019123 [Batillaria attramentaria]|uniref:Uncharacterized protein n=1 Tax=Batillaria attramentaria TaxID=370345 RepID=A0ABD0KR30_9CAEN
MRQQNDKPEEKIMARGGNPDLGDKKMERLCRETQSKEGLGREGLRLEKDRQLEGKKARKEIAMGIGRYIIRLTSCILGAGGDAH